MNNLTISIFGNQTFFEIINELESFFKFKIKYYDNLSICVKDSLHKDQLAIFFVTELNKEDFKEVKETNFPFIIITKSSLLKNVLSGEFAEKLNIPFTALDLKKKIVSLFAKYAFRKNSLIDLQGYIIDKNTRIIKKNNLELQLTEKEINFLILFSESNEPLTRNFVLKKVWKYSPESDTHTVETHIHRLRKKILKKFDDNNFIKVSKKGYYI